MTNPPRDAIDSILDSILSDESPLSPEDQEEVDQFDKAIERAEIRIGQERLARARDAAFADQGIRQVSDFAKEKARRIVQGVRAGKPDPMTTMAARFGDGSMEGDMEAVEEDIAESIEDAGYKD